MTRIFGSSIYTGYRIHFLKTRFLEFMHNSVEALEFQIAHLSGISFGKVSVKSVLKQYHILKN